MIDPMPVSYTHLDVYKRQGIDDARNFVIWLSESYIPEVEKTGILQNPRLTHILLSLIHI